MHEVIQNDVDEIKFLTGIQIDISSVLGKYFPNSIYDLDKRQKLHFKF